jgi:hypothetical protein
MMPNETSAVSSAARPEKENPDVATDGWVISRVTRGAALSSAIQVPLLVALKANAAAFTPPGSAREARSAIVRRVRSGTGFIRVVMINQKPCTSYVSVLGPILEREFKLVPSNGRGLQVHLAGADQAHVSAVGSLRRGSP